MSEVDILAFLREKRENRNREIESLCGPDSVLESWTQGKGRYKLEVETHVTGKGTWPVARAKLYRDGQHVKTLFRNYRNFPCAFILNHGADGGDYLVYGESYIKATALDLNTLVAYDITDPDNEDICWNSFHPSPNGTMIVSPSCPWGGVMELRVWEFSDPKKAVKLNQHITIDEFDVHSATSEKYQWRGEDSFELTTTYDTCYPFNKREDDLTIEEEAEWDKMTDKMTDEEYNANLGTTTDFLSWLKL